jgi:1-acyl-sn-glycerol-3-phosphate acyltransferase
MGMTLFMECANAAELLGLHILRHTIGGPRVCVTTYTVKQQNVTLFTCNHVSALDAWLEARFVAELVTYPAPVYAGE